jgi:hypothetical protein
MLKMTVVIPAVVRMAPNSVTDMPSRGKKTGIATEKKPRPTAIGLAPRTTRLVLVGIFPKECNDQINLPMLMEVLWKNASAMNYLCE